MTSTERRERPNTRAPLNPATPPPITITSCVVVMLPSIARDSTEWQALLPAWQNVVMHRGVDLALATVGPRLSALRRQRDMTLGDLFAATNISVSTLSR